MSDYAALLQVAGIVFAAGILWERLNSLNKKVTEQNGKLTTALLTIAKLEVGRSNNHERIDEIHEILTKHIKDEDEKFDRLIASQRAAS